MTTFFKTFIRTTCCAALIASGTAQAHYLWIESGDSGARLHYGEPDALLKEKSPGKLDNIKAPKAFVQDTPNGKPGAVAISRNADYFAITNNNGASVILAVEESLEVRDLTKHGLGFAKSNYYARYGQAGTDSSASPLVLDTRGKTRPSAHCGNWTICCGRSTS